jgi:NAD(P)-dependent dehydrogenase (short-subunit alcohol dehydrogenase family)
MLPREEFMRDFHDKVAFVTGGASGLGFALARAFGRARMKVMLADIDVASLENAVAELKKDQISVRGVECDVSDRTSVQRAAAETLAAFGKVHVVCNNAGPVSSGGPLELTTPGDCDWMIGVDLMGTIYGCQTFLPHIRAHGEGGHIVSTASVTGLFPVPGVAIHNAAKAAVISLSQTLAAELAGTSIGVSVLVPGFMRTRIAEREHTDRNRPKRFGERTAAPPQSAADQFAAFVRAGMDPNEVAEKVMHGIKENELFIFFRPGMANHTGRAFPANVSRLPSGLSPSAGFLDTLRTQKSHNQTAADAEQITSKSDCGNSAPQ